MKLKHDTNHCWIVWFANQIWMNREWLRVLGGGGGEYVALRRVAQGGGGYAIGCGGGTV